MPLLVTALLASAALFGIAWFWHWRAAKRLSSVLDAYAEREIRGRTRTLSCSDGRHKAQR
jgi:hypothetical protein